VTRQLACLTLIWLALGCEQALPDISWERMMDQPKGKAFRASPYFADGKVMQAPPEGTVPADRAIGPRPLLEGLQGEDFVSAVPVAVDRPLLVRGRNRFETFCATCHGIDGSGQSLVAHNMELRRPPSLVAAPVTEFPAGRVFQVISTGYGLMPSYAVELPVSDRWAVVAYLHALQRSQAMPLASLPESIRRRAEESLR
jgi:mono/diheme cytochrome c family protein